ncbi:MAG TPA: hypothetical protein VMM12_05435 [Longimicrobiales bacterium]|nr:hypothetical protein [Longimicrobiales bacterium]
MDDQQAANIYLALYQQELGHRDAIDARVQFAAGLVVVLAGAALYLTGERPQFGTPLLAWVFWVALSLGYVTLVAAAFLVARSYWSIRSSYTVFPDLRKAEEYRQRLIRDRETYGAEAMNPDQEFHSFVVDSLTKAAGEGRKVNLTRADRLFWGGVFLVVAAILLGLAAIPFQFRS